jgi:hypothetical protein
MPESTQTDNITCKNCGSNAVYKFGTYKGTQLYMCKSEIINPPKVGRCA